MTMKNAMVLVALAVAAGGCSSSPIRHSDPRVDMAPAGLTDLAGGGGPLDSLSSNGDTGIRFDDLSGGGSTNCSTAAQLIYVIDNDGTLSSFTPNFSNFAQSTFHDIGTPNCGAAKGYEPFSMSVDRNATAWVEYANQSSRSGKSPNKLYEVSTANASCTDSGFVGGQAGFQFFGMGFVADSSGGTTDTLYLAGATTLGTTSTLGTLDLGTLKITSTNGTISSNPELTGTGTGQLWAFIPGDLATTAHVSQLDKTTAAETNMIALGSSFPDDLGSWAFAYYGGDFFIFGGEGDTGATVVYHVTTAGVTETLDTQTRHIVGAGVSTCAPTVPPPPPT